MKARQNGAGVTLPDTLRTQYICMKGCQNGGMAPSLRNQFFFSFKKLKSFFLFFFCSKLTRTSKWWDGTLRRTCSYPRHTTTLFVRGKLMKMTGPLLRSIYADTYASCMLTRMLLVPCSGQCMLTRMLQGSTKMLREKTNEKNVTIFFIDLSGKFGPIF